MGERGRAVDVIGAYPIRSRASRANSIERLLDRLELTLRQIEEVEAARDAILKKPAPADEAERMIRSLVDMRAIGNAALLPRGLGIAEPCGHGAHGPQQGPAK